MEPAITSPPDQQSDQALPGDQRAIADAQASAGPTINRSEQPTPQAPAIVATVPEEIKSALRELVRAYELESDAVRRHKVRVWRQGEEYWRGNQNIWFSEKDSNWHAASEQDASDRMARFDYSLNMYRPWGLSIMASLVQSPPKIEYQPVSAESQDDIATARAATRVAAVVERNNRLQTLRVRKAYFLWTQGIYATYVRYVVDGGQFGYHDEPVLGSQTFQVLPDRFECSDCGGYQPAAASGGLLAGGPVACQNCGVLMGSEAFSPAEHVTADVPTGTRKVANGAEKLDAYGPLYFKVPPQAQSQRDCYYLIQVFEQHKATLRAAYPQMASQIDDVGSGGEDTYERIVRLSLADAQGSWNSLPMSSLITYKRAWLRPEAFWAHADEATRSKLLEMFPDGCRVEFAGDVFLTAQPERLDDCWVMCTGQPGIGIYRDPLGLDAISIQQQINDSANLLAEHRLVSSAPPVLVDGRYINARALKKKRMQLADFVEVIFNEQGPPKPMSEIMFQPKYGIDPAIWNDGERLAEAGQFVTGALPSIFGGGIPNLKTAAAYAQSRDQAMGRLALIWKEMRESEAMEMTLAIECFRRNRSEDVELVVSGKSGQYRSEYIRLNEIRGSVVARPSADEDFPTSFGQIRESLEQIMASKDPDLLALIGAPVNRPILQHYLGLPDLVDPSDDNRAKQFIEIEGLLGSEPVATPKGPQTSIPPDLYVDDHDVHEQVIRDWAVSDAGLQAKASRPQGYANVLLHLIAHEDAKQTLAAEMAVRQKQVAAAAAPPPATPVQPSAQPSAQLKAPAGSQTHA